MSKTIEFVERQLIFTKEEERITKKQLEQIPPNEKLRINALKIKLQTIKNNLIQLEQIKCELEAWEIVKPSISKEHLEDCQIRTMYGENPFMNVSQEEATKVKKALGWFDDENR